MKLSKVIELLTVFQKSYYRIQDDPEVVVGKDELQIDGFEVGPDSEIVITLAPQQPAA